MRKTVLKSDVTSKDMPVSIWFIAITIFIIILANLIKSSVEERKEMSRNDYKKSIEKTKVSHKIKKNQRVFFDFKERIKNRSVKIKDDEDKKGVTLYLEYFPSGNIGYYTDEQQELHVYDYTDTGVYVKSTHAVNLNLSLIKKIK